MARLSASAIKAGEAYVLITARTSELSKGLDSARAHLTGTLDKMRTRINRFGANVMRRMRMVGVAIGAAFMVAGAKAIKLGMDAVESENLFEVSMGKMAKSARNWSKELRKNLGLNDYELRKTIGTFNVMFKSMGMGAEKAYDLSTGLVELTYDMASFYNLRPEEAFEKVRSGMVGMSRPLLELGINLQAMQLQTLAATMGFKKNWQEMTEAEKVMVRYRALIEQTGDAQGDMARTLDSPANKVRLLKESFVGFLTDVGKKIIAPDGPISGIDAIRGKLEEWRDWVDKNGDKIQGFFKDLTTGAGNFWAKLTEVLERLKKMGHAIKAFKERLTWEEYWAKVERAKFPEVARPFAAQEALRAGGAKKRLVGPTDIYAAAQSMGAKGFAPAMLGPLGFMAVATEWSARAKEQMKASMEAAAVREDRERALIVALEKNTEAQEALRESNETEASLPGAGYGGLGIPY